MPRPSLTARGRSTRMRATVRVRRWEQAPPPPIPCPQSPSAGSPSLPQILPPSLPHSSRSPRGCFPLLELEGPRRTRKGREVTKTCTHPRLEPCFPLLNSSMPSTDFRTKVPPPPPASPGRRGEGGSWVLTSLNFFGRERAPYLNRLPALLVSLLRYKF